MAGRSVDELIRELDHRARLHEAIAACAELFAESRDLFEILKSAVAVIRNQIGIDRVGIFLFDPEKKNWHGAYGTDVDGALRDERSLEMPKNPSIPIVRAAAGDVDEIFTEDYSASFPDDVFMRGVKNHFIVTMRGRGRLVGALSVDNLLSGRPIDERTREDLRRFTRYIALAIDNLKLSEELEKRRVRDEVARRMVELEQQYDKAHEELKAEMAKSRRLQEELKLVVKSARCLLWHSKVIDRGNENLDWNLRVFTGELEDFVHIEQLPKNSWARAWYFNRHPEDVMPMDRHAKDSIYGGKPDYRQEFRCRDLAGNIVWLVEDVRIAPAGKGEWHLFGVCTDITARKRAEAEREQLITDLKKALAEVKQLSGLLPICASCKRVRDDTGYWNQIEVYFRSHADVQFSHGLCPECCSKLYPGMEEGNRGRSGDL